MHLARTTIGLTAALSFGAFAFGTTAEAQPAPAAPPAVGVIEAIKRPITESSEFLAGKQSDLGHHRRQSESATGKVEEHDAGQYL